MRQPAAGHHWCCRRNWADCGPVPKTHHTHPVPPLNLVSLCYIVTLLLVL